MAEKQAKIQKEGFATSIERAIRRVRDADVSLEFWRRKNHMLRLIVAGDYSPIDDASIPQVDPSKTPRAATTNNNLYNVLVTDFTESANNLMFQSLRTLMAQSSARLPESEFDDMDSEMAAFHQSALSSRYGNRPIGCGMSHHKRLALMDYMIGGIGFTWDTVRRERITGMNIDALSVTWPQEDAMIPCDWPWIAIRISKPLYEWIEVFGKEAMAEVCDAHRKGDDDCWLDVKVCLCWYWDTDGMLGTMHVWVDYGQSEKECYIWSTPNPHTSFHNAFPEPFLPITETYHTQLPSVRNPIGIAELMLPAQMAARRAEKRFSESMTRLKPFWDIVEGTYDSKMLDAMEDAEAYAFLLRKEGSTPPRLVEGEEIPKALWDYHRSAKEGITGMGGASPYASGSRQPNVKYSSEVDAIQQAGGLMVSIITNDHADDYRRSYFKALSNMRLYDKAWIRIPYRGTYLTFGPGRPISEFIDPVTMPSVSDESLAFVNKERATGEAANLLSIAAPFQALFPNSVKILYEDLLKAAKKSNVKEHLAPPVTALGQTEEPDKSSTVDSVA